MQLHVVVVFKKMNLRQFDHSNQKYETERVYRKICLKTKNRL